MLDKFIMFLVFSKTSFLSLPPAVVCLDRFPVLRYSESSENKHMPWESTCIQEQFIAVAISLLYKSPWLWNSHERLFYLIALDVLLVTQTSITGMVRFNWLPVSPDRHKNIILLCDFWL